MYATMLFPLAAICMAVVSYLYPQLLASGRVLIEPLLGLVMLGMGMTLRPDNFADILKRPRLVLIGLLLQFGVMPAVGLLVSRLFGLPWELMVGVVLLGSCPGGTASNVICYLARADLALSITLTTCSTLLAVFATPLLTWAYVGTYLEVPVANMMLNILVIIVLPVTVGVILNARFHARLQPLKHAFPYISVAAIVLIIGIIVAITRPYLAAVAMPVLAVVFWHNALGLFLGYRIARWFGLEERVCRTMALEVGMQNSGLAVALAQHYFAVMSALPGALFSIWHNITGSMLAWHWGARSTTANAANTAAEPPEARGS